MTDKQIDDLVGRAEQAWMSFCEADGKETMEMAEPRDLFQMGFNSGVRAALERQRVDGYACPICSSGDVVITNTIHGTQRDGADVDLDCLECRHCSHQWTD